MAATVAILDHMMPKITRCAILKPLEYPEAKSKANSETSYFPKFKMAAVRPSLIETFFDWCRDLDNVHTKYEDNP